MLVPLLNKFWIKEMSANKSFNVLPHTNIPAYFSVNLSCSSYTLHVCRVHWLVARIAGDERIKYYFPIKSIALGCKVRYDLLGGNYLDIPGCTSTSKIWKNPTNFGFRIIWNFFFFFFYPLTLELQIITLCNVCPGFLETSTLKCGHMSNNVPQSIVILILVTFLP